jgi:hypothetical protein
MCVCVCVCVWQKARRFPFLKSCACPGRARKPPFSLFLPSGTIPSNLGNKEYLVSLQVDTNSFSGSLDFLKDMSSLQVRALGRCVREE